MRKKGRVFERRKEQVEEIDDFEKREFREIIFFHNIKSPSFEKIKNALIYHSLK